MTTLHRQMYETAQKGDEATFLEQREEVIRLFLITYIQVSYGLFLQGSEQRLEPRVHMTALTSILKAPTSQTSKPPTHTSEGMMRQLSWSSMRRSSGSPDHLHPAWCWTGCRAKPWGLNRLHIWLKPPYPAGAAISMAEPMLSMSQPYVAFSPLRPGSQVCLC